MVIGNRSVPHFCTDVDRQTLRKMWQCQLESCGKSSILCWACMYNNLSESLVTQCCFSCNLSHNAIHWVFLAMFTLNGTCQFCRCKMYFFPFQLAIYSPVTAFLLLISSSLVLDVAIQYRRKEETIGGQIVRDCNLFPCGNIEAAGVSLIL